jgi:hypothetical protein
LDEPHPTINNESRRNTIMVNEIIAFFIFFL